MLDLQTPRNSQSHRRKRRGCWRVLSVLVLLCLVGKGDGFSHGRIDQAGELLSFLLCTAFHPGKTSSIRRDKTPKKKYLIVSKEEDIEHVKNNPVPANIKRAACITFNISREMGQSAQVETYLQGDSETVSHRRI